MVDLPAESDQAQAALTDAAVIRNSKGGAGAPSAPSLDPRSAEGTLTQGTQGLRGTVWFSFQINTYRFSLWKS